MSLVEANGVAVLSGTINRPQRGVWTADLVIDQPDGSGFDVGTQVKITTAAGLNLVGVVAPNRSGSFLDSVHVRVLGGAGGLTKAATARAYNQPGAFVRDVINGLISDSGETLAPTTDATFLATNLSAWTVMSQTCKRALDNIVETVDDSLTWRILDDGTLWVGAETWPTVSAPDAVNMTFDPKQGTYVIGEDAPSIAPGTNVDGIGHVGRVEHHLEPDSIRTVVYVASDDGVERGFKQAIKNLVGSELSRRGIDFHALYSAKVVSQNGDGTLELKPTSPKLPGLSKVPLRHGLPAVQVQVAPGCFVLVGWDGGDPGSPYACLWGGGETLTSLSIGSAADAVLTKADMTALISAITTMANSGNGGGALAFTPPTNFGSTTVKVQR